VRFGGAVAAGVFAASTWIASAAPPPPKPPPNEDCLTCHEDPSAKRADGSSIMVNKDAYAASVHGAAGASCVDCHTDLAKTTDFPHPEKLAPVDCSPCHAQQVEDYARSFHAASRKNSPDSKAARCVDCHGTHDIRPSKDPTSRTNHFNLPATCLKCHANPAIFPKAAGPSGNQPARFDDSIHGRALEKSGLKIAPNCATCHGTHDIRRPQTDPASGVYRTKVPGTCGSCHSRILGLYDESAHGTALARGSAKAPVCSDCHTAHAITDVRDVRRLQILQECGTCHEESLRTYRDTYHGQVTAMGFSRIATCGDCHTAHHVFPTTDARSTVSAANRTATCQKCHAGVSANFAKYDPHADPRNRSRNPVLHAAALFMRWLLVFVFSFFGIHTLLWFPRSMRARRENGTATKGSDKHDD
jgi:hypothetical protein